MMVVQGGVIMVIPYDAVRAFHHAFRKDIAQMDAASNTAAQGSGNLDFILNRYSFFNEVLAWHALGEDEFVFPAVEKVAPLVSEPYQRDHRGLDSLSASLEKAVKASDALETTRITSAFKFHLNIHLDKEEAHLYKLFNERIPLQEQFVIAGGLSKKIPPERYPEAIGWLFPLITLEDRENLTRIWRQNMPEPVFVNVKRLIQSAIGDDWTDLARRIPELK
jgi:hypothetical protein